jgi:hypothetical protein
MAATNQTTVMEDLSYLLGESSIPSTGVEDRKRFIQRALDRVYRAYDWPMNKVTATVSMVAGIASLPSNVQQDSIIDIRSVQSGTGDDHIFQGVPYGELDNYPSGTYRYRLTGYEGTYVLQSSETTTDTLQLYYETTSPIINASISTPFPSSMCLARGALVYYRQAEDPQADIAQEEALFQQELDEVISQYNRSRPQPRAKTLHEAMGTYPGDINDQGAFLSGSN